MTDPSERREIDLPAGRIRYREAGEGKPVVFVHGFLVDGRLWDGVVDTLSGRCRCIAPDWPLGAHRIPTKPGTDLSPPGMAALISSFLEALGLEDVTLVGNDTGGALSQVTATRHPERIGRLVLTNCDSHENFPPGPAKALPPIAKLPGAVGAMTLPLRVPAAARLAFKPFAKTPIGPELVESWVEPVLSNPGVRHDARELLAAIHRRHTLEAAEELRGSELPILLAWAPGDRFFPLRYAERLASEAGNARLVEIPDAGTFVPLDQPQRLAEEIASFAGTS